MRKTLSLEENLIIKEKFHVNWQRLLKACGELVAAGKIEPFEDEAQFLEAVLECEPATRMFKNEFYEVMKI